MAKKDKKKSAKKDSGSPADAVRAAVEQAFAASAASTRGRAQELVDDITSAASRVRETLDDLRVLEDLKGLRTEMESLARRVAELESKVAEAPAARAPARKPTTGTTASRAAAAKRTSAARASAGTKPAGTRAKGSGATGGTRAKPTAAKGSGATGGTRTRRPAAKAEAPAPDASSGRS